MLDEEETFKLEMGKSRENVLKICATALMVFLLQRTEMKSYYDEHKDT